MIIFLPKAADGLPAFEQSLTAANLKQWFSKLGSAFEVIVTVPKFKLTKQFGLQDTLSAMGMRQAFDSHSADFSGMIGKERREKDRLYISAVIHKAYVAVD